MRAVISSPVRCRGVTLIELIVTIAIVAIAVAAVMGVVSVAAARSAENLVQTQAVIVAESYLNEILQKPYGFDCSPACTRPQMDKAGDYGGLVDTGVRDASGTPIAPLAAYTVAVTVTNTAVGTVPAELVTVTVTPPNGTTVVLNGYRMQYP
jgi:MSHA pilin protein MshD